MQQFLFQNINVHHWPLGEFVVFENECIVFFEGFWKCPFEAIVEASSGVSNELQL